MTTITLNRTNDPAAAVGRALADLRRKNELDGQPDEARRRYFLSKQEHQKAKKSCQRRVGGKPERKRLW